IYNKFIILPICFFEKSFFMFILLKHIQNIKKHKHGIKMFVPTILSGIKSGLFSLAAVASLTSPETDPIQKFWYTYLTQEKEQHKYIQTLVKHLPADVLYEILSKYIVLIGDTTKRSICDN